MTKSSTGQDTTRWASGNYQGTPLKVRDLLRAPESILDLPIEVSVYEGQTASAFLIPLHVDFRGPQHSPAAVVITVALPNVDGPLLDGCVHYFYWRHCCTLAWEIGTHIPSFPGRTLDRGDGWNTGGVVRGRGQRWAGLLAVALLVAAGCGSGDPRAAKTSDPVAEPGVVSEPGRLVIVDPLPEGWSVKEAERPDYVPTALHTLYLPPGSTPEEGPALAVGEFGSDNGVLLCGDNSTEIPADGSPGGSMYSERSGALVSVQRSVHDEMTRYVLRPRLDRRADADRGPGGSVPRRRQSGDTSGGAALGVPPGSRPRRSIQTEATERRWRLRQAPTKNKYVKIKHVRRRRCGRRAHTLLECNRRQPGM